MQILGKFCADVRVQNVTTDGPIFANLVSKDAQDLKEKSHEKACREAVADFVQGGGGVKLTPPPVKIGLILILCSAYCDPRFVTKSRLCSHESVLLICCQFLVQVGFS